MGIALVSHRLELDHFKDLFPESRPRLNKPNLSPVGECQRDYRNEHQRRTDDQQQKGENFIEQGFKKRRVQRVTLLAKILVFGGIIMVGWVAGLLGCRFHVPGLPVSILGVCYADAEVNAPSRLGYSLTLRADEEAQCNHRNDARVAGGLG